MNLFMDAINDMIQTEKRKELEKIIREKREKIDNLKKELKKLEYRVKRKGYIDQNLYDTISIELEWEKLLLESGKKERSTKSKWTYFLTQLMTW